MLKTNGPPPDLDLPSVAVPEVMLSDPDRFGGRRAGAYRVGTLQLRGGALVGLQASDTPATRLVLPKLTEPHIHLDKCHTIERLDDVGGDLAAAAAAQLADKARWTADDLATRMRRGLRELAQAGCALARTHIDWSLPSDQPPLAWQVACDLREEARQMGVTLQVAALVDIDQMADPTTAAALATQVARDGGVLGAFVLNHTQREAGIRAVFAQADRLGLALDFHVDEGLDPALNGLEIIQTVAQDTRFQGPILCGHACSLASRPEAALQPLADGLSETGIAVAALPSTNLYLQGRSPATPTARGLTRIHALQARGVSVVLGSDNVRDAFCPVGRHDPLYSLSLAVLAAHLDPPLPRHLPMITTQAQRALGQPPLYVDSACATDLILFDAPDLSTVLSAQSAPQAILPQGEFAHG